METYYITGISGFLGRNIVLKLLEKEDIRIIGMVLPNEKNLDFFLDKENISLVKGNILNNEDLERFFSYGDYPNKIVLHVAGMISIYKTGDPLTTKINVEGTRNVLEVLKGKDVKKFVYISSVDSLNKRKGDEPIHEQDHYYPDKVDGVYSKSKANANNLVLDAVKEGLPGMIVLPSALLGPNDPFSAPINDAIKKFLNKKLPAITKGGYDLVDVRDVSEGILQAVKKGRVGESYLLTGSYSSVKDLIGLAAEVSHRKPVKFMVPHFIIKLISPILFIISKIRRKKPLFSAFSMDCLMQNSNYSHEKSFKELGYASRPLKDTLIDTIEYLESR